jgi:hypothetical protein
MKVNMRIVNKGPLMEMREPSSRYECIRQPDTPQVGDLVIDISIVSDHFSCGLNFVVAVIV